MLMLCYNEAMQPEQPNDSLPPINTSPPPVIPPNVPPNSEPKGPPKWIWFVVGGVVLLAIIIAAALGLLLMNSSKPSGQTKQEPAKATTVTINGKPYVYACGVATEADYARIFKLDNTNVGTVYERSALSSNDIAGDERELTRVGPVSGSGYIANCSYTLAKKDAHNVTEIDVSIYQAGSEEEATSRYHLSRSSEAQDYTDDDVDNGKIKLSTLPSFPENSFVVLPAANDTSPEVEATFLANAQVVTIKYALATGETASAVVLLIDEYAKAIQTKLNGYKEGGPTDLTGRQSFVGKKFVDVCKRSGMQKIGEALGGLQLRPDRATSTSTYGSLEGSRAAGDGVVSSCDIGFRTKADHAAQDVAKQQNARLESLITGDSLWPHDLGIKVNTFRTVDEARARYAEDKASAAKPHPNFGAANVTDLPGIGESAFKSFRETKGEIGFGGNKVEETYRDTEFVVVSGIDVFTVTLQQTASQKDYTSQFADITDTQLKTLYELLKKTLADNRK